MPTPPSQHRIWSPHKAVKHIGLPELDTDYVDESHIKAFEEALKAEDVGFETSDFIPASPASPGVRTPAGPRVRKVSALSDFAPVNLRVQKRRKPDRPQGRGQEWLFVLVRWPLLSLIFLFIGIEFSLYVLIRQLVNTKEWLSAWRGRKGVLRKRLREAKTYEEWKDAALALDEYLNFDEWKVVDEDPYFDWKLVRKVLRSLRLYREKGDAHALLGVLETCVRTNFAGVESSRLYSETFYGTKELIETYINELEKALGYIRSSPDLSLEEKKRFFKSSNTNLGTTALCLSGGATFGYYHFGIVKAFLDQGLLPRVISGTSAGGLVAALVCTRTDSELKRLLVPELADRITACEEPFSIWFRRFWTTGARFDAVSWARKCTFFTRGSMTFKEAYMRTGRILNISVIPADRHSPTKLLNYMTAPDTVIWSALLASAAVPGILNPVVLLQKLKDGTLIPWNWGSKFKDGSLRVDIPIQSLNLYFNVTNTIVSQVNPHVHLFFFAPRGSAGKPVAHRKGKGWRGNFLLSAAEQWLKLELTKNFRLIRDLDLLPQLLGQDWSSVFLQRFDGTVTIWPRTCFADWIRILSDPDRQDLERMIHVGQLVTWPKLHIIENRFRLEKQILLGRQAIRRAMQPKGREVAPEGLPPPVTGSKLSVPSMTPNTSQSPDPLPMDSDTESAYVDGAIQPSKHASRQSSPLEPISDAHLQAAQRERRPGHHPHHHTSVRRRWPINGRHGEGDTDPIPESDYGRATPDPPPPPSEEEDDDGDPELPASQSPPSPSTLFKRLRRASTTFSPFASLRKNSRFLGQQRDQMTEPAWSAESSSSDEDLSIDSRRHLRHPSIMENWGNTGEEFETDDER